jgi:CheY-like chemotaxis protein
MRLTLFLKVVLSVVLVTIASTRFYYYDALSTRMDVVFLSLVLSAFLLWMIPWDQLWERLRGINVGGFEISLQQPQVKAAIGGLPIDERQVEFSGLTPEAIKDRLHRRLESLDREFQTVRGSRVLWIDDNPHNILGERRLLRALGIDVRPVRSSEQADEVLREDNDFDLIITDVQRHGMSYMFVDKGEPIHEGVNFVVKLRKVKRDERIRNLPVIFYGAYPWESLVQLTRPARELQPEPEISNSVDDLIPKVVRRLAEEGINPITVSAKK